MRLVQLAMKYKQVTLAVFSLFMIAGIYALLHMPRSENPEIPVKQGLVIAILPGASTTEVENQITQKLEDYLFEYKEIKKTKTFSTTSAGRVVVQVELEDWYPIDEKDIFWSKLQSGLMQAAATDLPQGLIGPIVQGDFGETTALMLAVSSDQYSFNELEDYLDILKDGLQTIPEVSKLQVFGKQKEQIQVSVSTEKLSQYNLGINQITQAITQHNSTAYSGEVDLSGNNIQVFSDDRYRSEEELANQIITTSQQGSIIRLKDVADIQRVYADRDQSIIVKGKKALMLSIEMQQGNNIVEFGEKLNERIDQVVEARFPEGVSVDTIYSQPESVDHAIGHFFTEFAIAIGAVILVVMILLPFRLATISAIASPVSILITLAVMYLLGIGLHSVSLAGLIVVLGMVVDDAIIIVDNYIEKLDEGYSRWEAGWRSATQLFIPILTATLTIIFAFLPLSFLLEGIAADFIKFMPYTVSIALATSFFVAIFLTPYLCFIFVKKGLKKPEKSEERKPTFLDRVQAQYDKLVEASFKHKKIALGAGVVAIVLGGFLMGKLPEEFFPRLNRATFNLEVWLPEGSTYDNTHQAVERLLKHIESDERIKDVSAYVGTSSPRFFSTYAPEAPAENYAQLFINAKNPKAAGELIREYEKYLEDFLPESKVRIKRLSYQNSKTPVEIRLIGENLDSLQVAANSVTPLLQEVEGARWVHTNYKNPYYALEVDVNKEQANRLNISTVGLAQTLGASLKGAPISSFWEGDEAKDIVVRVKESEREDFTDLNNLYVNSPTGAKVPLRQVATLNSTWEPGLIVRRNGLRTVTIRAETTSDKYASDILTPVQEKLAEVDLPAGVAIDYGGDLESSEENLPNMLAALGVSVLLIFLTLMFQFKSLSKTFIILTTFPLSILGAATGLLLTSNPFGFTAFLGIISLIGIVVRNGIVLVDYADELVHDHDYSIGAAAMAAAKRRMRPIFLTSSAAAIGVVPMIVGGSPLWSPLGSVLSVGLMFSMFMTLLIIPVMYSLFVKMPQPSPDEVETVKVPHLSTVNDPSYS